MYIKAVEIETRGEAGEAEEDDDAKNGCRKWFSVVELG